MPDCPMRWMRHKQLISTVRLEGSMRANARIKRLMDGLPDAVPNGYALFLQSSFHGSTLLLFEKTTNRIVHTVYLPGADGGDLDIEEVDGIEYIDRRRRPPNTAST
jgi:hypothetical protein